MIYVDVSEKDYVHKAAKKSFPDLYMKKMIGCNECKDKKIPLHKDDVSICVEEEQAEVLIQTGFIYNRDCCIQCKHSEFVRFADFEIGEGRAFIERKTSPDFLSSRKARLYDQLNKMDRFLNGRKILLVEGTQREKTTMKFGDSKNYFSQYDKKTHDLRGMSPMEQCVEIAGSKEWTWSFTREAFMRDIWVLPTVDLEETMEFLKQMHDGFDEESKYRAIPKDFPQYETAQNMLMVVKGIGKYKSWQLLHKYETLDKVFMAVKKAKKDELASNHILRELKNILTKKPKRLRK
ncbi:MAG: hypothetical protein GY853_16495 [PVC group bacterium]|nr:hypothetical protein [PVC group bacterium]